MRATPLHVIATAAVIVALAGCAQPQPDSTDDPVVAAPSDASVPDPKPTSPMSQDQQYCYDDLLNDPATEEHHGGDVPWPAPLTDEDFPIEPSCWYDTDQSGSGSFAADWRVLGPTDRDLVLTAAQDALAAAGLSVSFTSGDGAGYHIDSYVDEDVTIEVRYDDNFDSISIDTVPTA